jgi:hypothetical protein
MTVSGWWSMEGHHVGSGEKLTRVHEARREVSERHAEVGGLGQRIGHEESIEPNADEHGRDPSPDPPESEDPHPEARRQVERPEVADTP